MPFRTVLAPVEYLHRDNTSTDVGRLDQLHVNSDGTLALLWTGNTNGDAGPMPGGSQYPWRHDFRTTLSHVTLDGHLANIWQGGANDPTSANGYSYVYNHTWIANDILVALTMSSGWPNDELAGMELVDSTTGLGASFNTTPFGTVTFYYAPTYSTSSDGRVIVNWNEFRSHEIQRAAINPTTYEWLPAASIELFGHPVGWHWEIRSNDTGTDFAIISSEWAADPSVPDNFYSTDFIVTANTAGFEPGPAVNLALETGTHYSGIASSELLPDDDLLVGWTSGDLIYSGGQIVEYSSGAHVGIVSAQTGQLISHYQLPDAPNSNQSVISVSNTPDGYVVLWRESPWESISTTAGDSIRATFFDAATNAPKRTDILNDNTTNVHGAQVYHLNDGGLLVLWTNRVDTSKHSEPGTFFGSIYSPSTGTFSAAHAIADNLSINLYNINFIAMGGSSFALHWDNYTAGVETVIVNVDGYWAPRPMLELHDTYTPSTGGTIQSIDAIASAGHEQLAIATSRTVYWEPVAADDLPTYATSPEFTSSSRVGIYEVGAPFIIGTAGDDVLTAPYNDSNQPLSIDQRNPIILGRDGNDILYGDDGNDTLDGGNGDDLLVGSSWGHDILNGGAGTDTASYQYLGSNLTISLDAAGGGEVYQYGVLKDTLSNIENIMGSDAIGWYDGFGDLITGSAADNLIQGLGGNDTLFGGAGCDTLEGGYGDDTLVGNVDIFAQESDTLLGGDGNDTIMGEFTDVIDGGAGYDHLYAVNDFAWTIYLAVDSIEWMSAGFGDDTINAAGQTVGVTIYAGGGNDTVTGSGFADFLWAGVGNDVVNGGAGDDIIIGDLGADKLSGGDGNDAIYTDGADTKLDGGNGTDALYITGGSGLVLNMATTHFEWVGDFAGGNDVITATALPNAAVVYAGGGNDTVIGGGYGDFLWGEAGNDSISGAGGDDTLVGGTGADILNGGTGYNFIYANSGAGGDGLVDTIVVDSPTWWGHDYVYDFEPGIDKINLHGTGATASQVIWGHAFGNTMISFNGTGSIFVMDANLTVDDIIF